jgi:two-component system, chemotaxis family, chemotaxis protein CheY
MSSRLSKKDVADLIQALCVVVVDDNQYMRKMIRNLLVNCGIEDIYEASDGIAALGVIRPATHSRHLRGPSAKFYDSTN